MRRFKIHCQGCNCPPEPPVDQETCSHCFCHPHDPTLNATAPSMPGPYRPVYHGSTCCKCDKWRVEDWVPTTHTLTIGGR